MNFNAKSYNGYSLLKTHTIKGSTDGDLTDYQVMFTVHRGNGKDSGSDVYLGGHSKNWPNDINFTNSNDMPLSYWIETYDPDKATIWVKVDHIPASPATTQIKVYAGRADDMGTSSGAATFRLFDDFSSGAIDANTWNVTGSPIVYDDGDVHAVEITPGNGITAKGLSADTYFAGFDMKYLGFSNEAGGGPRLTASIKDNGTAYYAFRLECHADGTRNNNYWSGTGIVKGPNPSSSVDSDIHLARIDMPYELNTWYPVELRGSTNKFKIDVDGTTLTATDKNDYTGTISFSTWGDGNNILITNIFVGNYTIHEPTHGDWTS